AVLLYRESVTGKVNLATALHDLAATGQGSPAHQRHHHQHTSRTHSVLSSAAAASAPSPGGFRDSLPRPQCMVENKTIDTVHGRPPDPMAMVVLMRQTRIFVTQITLR